MSNICKIKENYVKRNNGQTLRDQFWVLSMIFMEISQILIVSQALSLLHRRTIFDYLDTDLV